MKLIIGAPHQKDFHSEKESMNRHCAYDEKNKFYLNISEIPTAPIPL